MKLIKTSFFSGIHTLIKLIINVVIGKIFALYLGPAGISQLGNFMNMFVILNTTMSGGINNGVVKYVSENKTNKEQISKIIFNNLVLIIFFTFVTVFAYLFYVEKINNLLFPNTILSYDILIVFVFAAFFATIFNYFISVLNGLNQIKKMTLINIMFSILLLIFTLIFVSIFLLKGVILSNFFAFLLSAFIITFVVIKSYPFSLNFQLFDININKQFLQYTFMTFTSVVTMPLIQMYIRNHYTVEFGENIAGIWQAIVRLSESYLSVFSIILITYFLPKYSELKELKLIRHEIINGYKILIPSLIIFFLFLFYMRYFIINLLYSKQFDVVADYLPIMFLGDLFKISSWILAFLFFAKSKTKAFIFSELTFGLILLIGTVFLSEKFQLKGYVYSYVMCYFMYFIFCVVYFRKYLLK